MALRGSGMTLARTFALVVGIVYLGVGVVGFLVTGFGAFVEDTGKSLLGFDLNPFHNVVHIVIGAALLTVSRLDVPDLAEGVLIGGGLVYLLAAVVGFAGYLDLLAINETLDPDNFLHLVSGLAALAVGLASGGSGARARSA